MANIAPARNSFEAAYIRVLDALGFVINGVPYIRPSATLRREYTKNRKAGLTVKQALGMAMGYCEKRGI